MGAVGPEAIRRGRVTDRPNQWSPESGARTRRATADHDHEPSGEPGCGRGGSDRPKLGLARLNLYHPGRIIGSVLRVEDVNLGEVDMQRRLWCCTISAKRYCLYVLDDHG